MWRKTNFINVLYNVVVLYNIIKSFYIDSYFYSRKSAVWYGIVRLNLLESDAQQLHGAHTAKC